MDIVAEPLPIRACWLSWLAVSTSDQAALVGRLGLTDVRPTTWSAAAELVDAVAHSGEGRFSTVVVTPALDGWILVIGAWAGGLPFLSRTDPITRWCEDLSARFGRAQAYFHSEQNDGEAWLIADQGTVRRRWIAEFPELATGEPFGVERHLLDAFGIPGHPEDLDDEELASDWESTAGDCWATTVAAEQSLDPTNIGRLTPSAGPILIASTP